MKLNTQSSVLAQLLPNSIKIMKKRPAPEIIVPDQTPQKRRLLDAEIEEQQPAKNLDKQNFKISASKISQVGTA